MGRRARVGLELGMVAPLTNFERLCLHTMTTKPLSLRETVAACERAEIPGITVWRQHLAVDGLQESARCLADSSLKIVSLCRGGFFPALASRERQLAIDDTLRAIEEAHAIGAPLIVLVCGAVPGLPLDLARSQIREGIGAVLPAAVDAGVRLAVEPLHPVYAADRSAVTTMKQANDLVESLGNPNVGIALDVYHVWWDETLPLEIQRAGDRIFAFHVCDWRTPTRDVLNDRALMGEGCIEIARIRDWVESTGYDGMIEVEIFSDEYWAGEQYAYIERIKGAYLEHV